MPDNDDVVAYTPKSSRNVTLSGDVNEILRKARNHRADQLHQDMTANEQNAPTPIAQAHQEVVQQIMDNFAGISTQYSGADLILEGLHLLDFYPDKDERVYVIIEITENSVGVQSVWNPKKQSWDPPFAPSGSEW